MRVIALSVSCALFTAGLSGTAYAVPSSDCRNYGQTQNVADVRTSGLAIVVHQTPVDDTTSWICVYAGLDGFAGTGGRFVVSGVRLTPTVDTDVSACPTSSNVFAGQVGDPSNPTTYLPYRIAATTDPTTVTLCVTLGSANLRIAYPTTTGTPQVDFVRNPSTASDDPDPLPDYHIPSGSASSDCYQAGYYRSRTNLLWYSLFGGFQGFVNLDGLSVCYRTTGPAGARGGRVSFSFGAFDIWLPTGLGQQSECSTTLFSTTSPVATSIRTGSEPGGTWICASVPAGAVAIVARTDPRAPQLYELPGVTHTQD